MKSYITIAEAVELTNKHIDTIRTFCKKYPDELKKDKSGKVLIPKKLILEKYDIEESTKENKQEQKSCTENEKSQAEKNNEELIQILKDQIGFMRKQNEELRMENSKNTEMIAELFKQQQGLNGYMLQLQAKNESIEPEPEKKKHWWNR